MTQLPIEFIDDKDAADHNQPTLSQLSARNQYLEGERIALYFTIVVLIICFGWIIQK